MDIQTLLSRLQEKGLTQTEIASEIGCSQPSVSDMASGKVGTVRPSFKVVDGIQRLAEKHGIPIADHTRRSTDKEPG